MASVILFDVNETLLDLAALDARFEEAFGSAAARKAWFAQLLQSALVATILRTYQPFDRLAEAALEMTAAAKGLALSTAQRAAILEGMRELPPHADARPSLERLQHAGLRLAALTNSRRRIAQSQLQNAGLARYFEAIFSADEVGAFKPAPEPYRMAAKRLGVKRSATRLVAAHAWDIAGAARAGCATAFVARPGKALDPLGPKPGIRGRDLSEVAERIVEADAAVDRRRRRARPGNRVPAHG
jgi:2-haloacid dehalogenase